MGDSYVELSDCMNSICSNRIGCNMETDFHIMNACLQANCGCTQAPMKAAVSIVPESLCMSCGRTNNCNFQNSLAESNTCLSTHCGNKCDNTFDTLFTPAPAVAEHYHYFPFTRLN